MMLEGLIARQGARIAALETELAEARKDTERLEKLYEMAEVSDSGEIIIALKLAKESGWDGVTAYWSKGHFNAAVAAIKEVL